MTVNRLRAVIDAIRTHRFRYSDEEQLQEGLAAVLRAQGFDVACEVILTPRDRIDLLVDRVGIEVKVAGQAAAVARQVARYATSDRVDALLLITSRVRHVRLPPTINGKPVAVLALAGAGL